MKDVEAVAHTIVNSAIKVHRALGPGLLESVYQQCLTYELSQAGLVVACEVNQPVAYRNIEIQTGFRLDMLVEECVIIENKTVEKLLPIHQAQY